MDVKKIESLAKLMQETGLTGLELVEGDMELRLERQQEVVAVAPAAPVMPVAAPAPAAGAEAQAASQEQAAPRKEGALVLSPTVGVFYASPSPDARPFVEVGDQVKKGDTLCIIEAMKLMNEIPSEVDGTVAEICVGNGQVVEYNQPLFRIV
ncbi:MAG: acetyl-CoA carboxylase biotin carboxyl carrier protein [Acutalibacter sp.]|jgi:acetyl-CoA carboxylase biotin carboxyl carrier protein